MQTTSGRRSKPRPAATWRALARWCRRTPSSWPSTPRTCPISPWSTCQERRCQFYLHNDQGCGTPRPLSRFSAWRKQAVCSEQAAACILLWRSCPALLSRRAVLKAVTARCPINIKSLSTEVCAAFCWTCAAGLTKVPIDGQPRSIVQELEAMARTYIQVRS